MTGRTRFGHNIIDTEQIYDESITAEKIGALSVATGALQDDAVTNAKIAPDAVGTSELADDSVNADAIAHATITANHIGSLVPKIQLYTLKHTDTSPKMILAMPKGGIVYSVITYCTETFSVGTETLTVGTTSDPDGYLKGLAVGAGDGLTIESVAGDTVTALGDLIYDTTADTILPDYFTAAENIIATHANFATGGAGEIQIIVTYAVTL